MRSLGIDVGVRKGLDLVVLEDDLVPRDTHRGVDLSRLGGLIEELRPHVVAIDSPPAWARRGRSRLTERELRLFGIHSYGTPTGKRARRNPFYDWMRSGFRAFDIARRRGYRRYGGGKAKGTAMEVFPHATAVVLAGCLPPDGARKGSWRASVLAAQRVRVDALSSADQIDAALAAFTGLQALRGKSSALGDPLEGVIVLPARSLPAGPYRRCRAQRGIETQPRFPGMTPCACGAPGCEKLTAREFAPGHDAKRKSTLWKLARSGHDAVDELRRRGWELPPEMR